LRRKNSYSKNYHEFDDFVNDEERPKYQRERSGHRYFKYDDGKLVEKTKKKPALIWGGKDTSNLSKKP
jgi:hypothetical protein